MGERVQARYYSNNRQQWKLGKILQKHGQLHYLVELDDGYQFKRHIDQLRKTLVDEAESGDKGEPEQESRPQEPDIQELVLFQLDRKNPSREPEQATRADIDEDEDQEAGLRRSSRIKKASSRLRDYVTF